MAGVHIKMLSHSIPVWLNKTSDKIWFDAEKWAMTS